VADGEERHLEGGAGASAFEDEAPEGEGQDDQRRRGPPPEGAAASGRPPQADGAHGEGDRTWRRCAHRGQGEGGGGVGDAQEGFGPDGRDEPDRIGHRAD
jgi:hypothetical protein